jgi:hypothetical protein
MAVELGDRVKDKISGLSGVVVGVTNWLFGCRRLCVAPETSKDGVPASNFTVDEPQIEILQKGVLPATMALEQVRVEASATTAPVVQRHGPRDDPQRY